jgi:N-acetyl-anhydromuramyl-L-alanine amidase AmpD
LINNGWPNIGYHVVIKNGRAYWTNDLEERGYHNGFSNTTSVGVSIVANETDQPSMEDIRKLYQVVNLLRNDNRMNIKNLSSHSEIPGASTTCPGDLIRSEVLNMRKIWGLGKIGFGNLVASPMNRTETDIYSSEFADN